MSLKKKNKKVNKLLLNINGQFRKNTIDETLIIVY